MKQLTQHEKILNFMQSNGGITCVDAFYNGITQLAARIKELEKEGNVIIRTRIPKSRLVKYSLVVDNKIKNKFNDFIKNMFK
jgi:benzoyl-CoA reductase/2-hydroxyglutaryl-CoA dehydratase subunit BcrC/BadD/HgdB